jgi:hypothetical protein
VVNTIQYGLGILGFFRWAWDCTGQQNWVGPESLLTLVSTLLSSGDQHVTGNWGYLEQVAILCWSRRTFATSEAALTTLPFLVSLQVALVCPHK